MIEKEKLSKGWREGNMMEKKGSEEGRRIGR